MLQHLLDIICYDVFMIISIKDLSTIRRKHKSNKIVFAGGVFDLMHPGHLDLFNNMRRAGDIVVVAVSSDKRVKQRKGPKRPIHSEQTRLTMVGAVKQVDYALLAPNPTRYQKNIPSIQIMKSLKPDIFISSDEDWMNHQSMFNQLGITLKIIPRFSQYISTTRTVNKVIKRYSLPS